MTAIVALKKDGEVWMGADGLCLYDMDVAETRSQKIFLFPNFGLATCGLATYTIVIEKMLEDKQFLRSKLARMQSRADAAEFSLLLQRNLRDLMMDLPGNRHENQEYAGEFIIATPTTIYRADGSGYAYEVPSFLCAGSGGLYMDGFLQNAMKYQLDNQTAPELIQRALEIAVERSAGCGGELTILKICPESLPAPPPPPKKRKTKEEREAQKIAQSPIDSGIVDDILNQLEGDYA